jgi:chaperonin GroEL
MPIHYQPNVVREHVQSEMQRGFAKILGAVRPTLGPFPRLVAYDHALGSKPPEFLDDGGTIARRIIQLNHRTQDVGAMFLRQVLWRVRERVGDGAATTAILFEAVYTNCLCHLAAGGCPTKLRQHLETGMRLLDAELARMTISFNPQEQSDEYAHLARSICHDPYLAEMLGEILSVIGAYGTLDIRTGGSAPHWEFVAGTYWNGKLLSSRFETDTIRQRAELRDAAILISDIEVQGAQELAPLLTQIIEKTTFKALLLIVKSLPERAIHFLCDEPMRARVHVIAAQTPYSSLARQAMALQDLALLTGGRPLLQAAGQTLHAARLEDLGRAKLVWADRNSFGVIGGQGDENQIQTQLMKLYTAHRSGEDASARAATQERIGKLLGGSATLWIGGATGSEIETRKQLAERTARTLREAAFIGILPGGGTALLNCCPMLQERLAASQTLDERAAYQALLCAAEAPFRTMLTNAGYEPLRILDEIHRAGRDFGFDLHAGQVVNMLQAGIVDAAAVLRDAIRSAISGAALALTIDAVVHHRKPTLETEP